MATDADILGIAPSAATAPPPSVQGQQSPGDIVPFNGGPAAPGGGLADRAFLDWQQGGMKGPPPPRTPPPAGTSDREILGIGRNVQPVPVPTPSPQTTVGSGLANAAAGANQQIAGTLGAPVDLATRGINALTGLAGLPPIQNPVGGSQFWQNLMPYMGVPNPTTVPANTEAERALRGAGGAVASLPLMAMGGAGMAAAAPAGSLVGGIGQQMASIPMVPALAPVAVGGATGQVAEDVAPEPLKPYANMAGNVVGAGLTAAVPAAVEAGFNGLTGLAGRMGLGPKMDLGTPEPVTPAQATGAGQRIQKALGPEAFQQTRELVQQQPAEVIPGAPRTVAQITADRPEGVPIPETAGLEVSARSRMAAPFIANRNAQRNVMARGIEGMKEPGADPQALANFFMQELEQREAAAAAAGASAQGTAEQATQALGQPRLPEEIGAETRGLAQAGHENVASERRDLYKEMEQDKDLTLRAKPVKNIAAQLSDEIRALPQPITSKESGERKQVLDLLRPILQMPWVARYGDLLDFRRQIGDVLRPKQAGEALTDAMQRRLIMLRGGIDESIRQAVEEAARASPEFAAEIRSSSGGAVGGAPVLQEAVGRVPGLVAEGSGEESAAGGAGGTGEAPGGVPNAKTAKGRVEPTFTAAAAGRAGKAQAAAAIEHRTFGEGPVGQILAKGEAGHGFETPDAKVMDRVLSDPKTAAEKLAKLSDAIGPEPAQRLARESIIRRIYDEGVIGPDGILDAAKYERFRTGPMGRLIDQLGLGDQLGDAAKAQQVFDQTERASVDAIKQYRNGIAGRFLARDGMQPDPALAVRGALSGSNAAREMTRVINAVGNNQEAVASLRDHVADYLANRFTTVPEVGENAQADLLKAETFRNFIRDNRDWLRRLYPGNGGQSIQTLEQIAAELRRTKLVATAAEGSPTATYLQAGKRHGMSVEGKHSTLWGAVWAALGEEVGRHLGVGPITGMMAGLGAKVGTDWLRGLYQAGIETQKDLVAFAMAHPQVFKVLAERAASTEGIGTVAKRRIGTAIRTAVKTDLFRQGTDNAPGQ